MSLTRGTLEELLNRARKGVAGPGSKESIDAFVRRTAPPRPPWTSPLRRRHHGKAIAAAIEQGSSERVEGAWAVPMWIGDNDDDEAAADCWKLCLVVGDADGVHEQVDDVGADFGHWAHLHMATTSFATVRESRPEDDGDFWTERFGPFTSVSSPGNVVVVEVILDSGTAATRPRPTELVPAGETRARRAIELTDLPDAVRAAITVWRRDLELILDDEGNLVDSVDDD